ncbi:hypothetical protein FAP59_18670 [Morganella morganii]|nr:hypothetical protein [Morganella morganii]
MSTNPNLIPVAKWVMPTLSVADDHQLFSFSIQNAFNYHGYNAVGGVVLGFRLLQRAISLLTPQDEPLQCRELSLFTAFPGMGARDCFELVTRMVSENRFILDVNFDQTEAQQGLAGRFYFEFSYRGKKVSLAPVAGQPTTEFLKMGRASKQPDATPEVQRQWMSAKYQLANTLLTVSPMDAIRVL